MPSSRGVGGRPSRHLLDAYATWWVLRRYRHRAQHDHPIDTRTGRRVILAAIDLLTWLRTHEVSTATQPDIDEWAATLTDSRPRHTHEFLRWAHGRKLTTTTLAHRQGRNGQRHVG